MTIEIGTWAVPMCIALLIFAWAIIRTIMDGTSSGYGAIGDAVVCFIRLGIATVVTLLAWLIWSLWFR